MKPIEKNFHWEDYLPLLVQSAVTMTKAKNEVLTFGVLMVTNCSFRMKNLVFLFSFSVSQILSYWPLFSLRFVQSTEIHTRELQQNEN